MLHIIYYLLNTIYHMVNLIYHISCIKHYMLYNYFRLYTIDFTLYTLYQYIYYLSNTICQIIYNRLYIIYITYIYIEILLFLLVNAGEISPWSPLSSGNTVEDYTVISNAVAAPPSSAFKRGVTVVLTPSRAGRIVRGGQNGLNVAETS